MKFFHKNINKRHRTVDKRLTKDIEAVEEVIDIYQQHRDDNSRQHFYKFVWEIRWYIREQHIYEDCKIRLCFTEVSHIAFVFGRVYVSL